jgi:hypothetical protein
MVERIQFAVNGYYGQFEEPVEEPAAVENGAETAAPVAADVDGAESTEEPAASNVTEASTLQPPPEASTPPAPEEGSVTIENTEHPGA